ncbi:hypothetical protein NDU88_003039 [Pleurodeles waltl]|uniref:Uncharacterized protein n=1 Tax=Pleurodeles waltl TaxID=8319 RepID=A0AAV7SCM9_PLEWA|nr:hypothetical protein NDU88_003039 [Pleurodeles waltl]
MPAPDRPQQQLPESSVRGNSEAPPPLFIYVDSCSFWSSERSSSSSRQLCNLSFASDRWIVLFGRGFPGCPVGGLVGLPPTASGGLLRRGRQHGAAAGGGRGLGAPGALSPAEGCGRGEQEPLRLEPAYAGGQVLSLWLVGGTDLHVV